MSDELAPLKMGDKKIEIVDGPDSLGRYTYFESWVTDYIPGQGEEDRSLRWKSQIFFRALPDWYTEQEPT